MSARPCSGVVLVVDDEEDTRELLRELLEDRGFTVATACDGADALAQITNGPAICLVLLDLVMPVMDGHELLRRLAADTERVTPPIWISTSAPDQAPPGMPCLPKPVDVERLLALVDEHCA